ncbi:MAG: hypothetical protein AABZ47_01745 [Planctomycetota bacterium]
MVRDPDRRTEPALPSDAGRKFGIRWIWVVFILAMITRLAMLILMIVRGQGAATLEFPDEQQYWQIAQSIAAGMGMRDELGFQASRMPLFPLVLSLATFLPQGVLVARFTLAILGSCIAVIVMLLADRMFGGAEKTRTSFQPSGEKAKQGFGSIAVVAGLLSAIDPWLAYSSLLLLTDIPFTLALLFLWFVLPLGETRKINRTGFRRWLLIGVVASLCVYMRETGLPILILLGLFLAAKGRWRRETLLGLGVAAAVLGMALLPWAGRNRMILGEWQWLTTRAGISLYDGVGPQANGASDLGKIKQMPAVAGLTELAWNRYFQSESLKAIQGEPMRILRLAGTKLARTWNPVPNLETYRSASVRWLLAAWSLPTLVLAAMGSILKWTSAKKCKSKEEDEIRSSDLASGIRWKIGLLLIPPAGVTLLHTVFVGSVRYRLMAIPFLHILAALCIVAVVGTFSQRFSIGSTKQVDFRRPPTGNP